MVVLEVRGLTREYGTRETQVRALRGIDLKISAGECVAITGRSGSGKSTLLHLLAGIDVPTAGQVLLEGRDLASLDDEARTLVRRRRVGMIFQSFNLLPNLSAEENVALPLILDGKRRADALREAAERIEQVGLGARRGHVPSKLSGGEQQRIAIARALVIRPVVLLADEPTGNLDDENCQAVTRMLYGLAAGQGTTLVVVTHDAEVARQAGRIVRLADGRVGSDAPTAQGEG